MKILCIETSLAKCSVCLSYDGQEELVVAEEDFAHSERLFVLIENLLSKHNISYEALDFIACTIGPGSFGGIRVGVAAANALKILLPEVEVLGFNVLEIIANSALPIAEQFVVTIAHSSKCYIVRADAHGRLLDPVRAMPRDELAKIAGEHAVVITSEDVGLDAAAVMRFAQKIIHEGRTSLYNQVLPLYISEPSTTVAK